ncbi:hypothetical protein ACFLR7_00695 [Acidobacteriota bacterium]
MRKSALVFILPVLILATNSPSLSQSGGYVYQTPRQLSDGWETASQ